MHSVFSYLNFLIRSRNHHDVHSPFVYKLVTECFYDPTIHEKYELLKRYRDELINSDEIICITDYGAGSRVFNSKERKVSDIIKTAGISLKRAYLLHRLTSRLNCKTVLELGTSLGLAAAAMATANKQLTVTTIEGCPEITKKATRYLNQFEINNCEVINDTFEEFFTNTTLPLYDLIYLDGNHKKEPTLRYFSKLLDKVHNDSIMILDDIHWSKEMEGAWNEIIRHPKVSVSIDTYKWGILFLGRSR